MPIDLIYLDSEFISIQYYTTEENSPLVTTITANKQIRMNVLGVALGVILAIIILHFIPTSLPMPLLWAIAAILLGVYAYLLTSDRIMRCQKVFELELEDHERLAFSGKEKQLYIVEENVSEKETVYRAFFEDGFEFAGKDTESNIYGLCGEFAAYAKSLIHKFNNDDPRKIGQAMVLFCLVNDAKFCENFEATCPLKLRRI